MHCPSNVLTMFDNVAAICGLKKPISIKPTYVYCPSSYHVGLRSCYRFGVMLAGFWMGLITTVLPAGKVEGYAQPMGVGLWGNQS